MAALTVAAVAASSAAYSRQASDKQEPEWRSMQPRRSPALESSKSPKCPGCGSFEYRYHNMVRICSYCRTGQ